MFASALSHGLSAAVSAFQGAKDVNEESINAFLKSVAVSLLQADINAHLVAKIRDAVRSQAASSEKLPTAQLKRKINQALFTELSKLLSPKEQKALFKPKKSQTQIVMFVGLQGAGKTTTCAKYAKYWKRKGWKPALVCTDTFRAGAFDQLKQNAARIQVAFYGSYSEMDPAIIAAKGVALFQRERMDLIIIDTSGRHKQEDSLLEELKAINAAVNPHETIYVMDGHLGQAAGAQAEAFRKTVNLASVIVTKLDGSAKGGGAIAAVAATGCPISFIGTGESFDAFESFDPDGFVSRLMGMGDPKRFLAAIKENQGTPSKETIQRISKGNFTFTDLQTQLKTVHSMGSVTGMMSLLPGMSGMLESLGPNTGMVDKETKRQLCIIQSMTAAERDCRVELCESRIRRLARGSGSEIVHVQALIEQRKMMASLCGKMGRGLRAARGRMP